MKQHVKESLNAFQDHKFFTKLFEADDVKGEKLSPAERKAIKEKIKAEGMKVIKKCYNNFSLFKKDAGDIWQEYRDFWATQQNQNLDQTILADNKDPEKKGIYYNLYMSEYVVGVVKEENGAALLKVYNTSQKTQDSDEFVAFKSTNPDVVKSFVEFFNNEVKATMKNIIEKHKDSMSSKQAAAEAQAKADTEAAKKARLDAFLGA